MLDGQEYFCDGDFSIQATNEDTRLTAIAPVISESPQITQDGDYREWEESEWNNLIRRVETWGRRDLTKELKQFGEQIIASQILSESPIFDDDDESRRVKAIHTLELHYSKKRDYLIIRGTATYQYYSELRELGLQWDSHRREWRAKYSWEDFKEIKRFIEEYDTTHDPREVEYVKCPRCERWKPMEKQCQCRQNRSFLKRI